MCSSYVHRCCQNKRCREEHRITNFRSNHEMRIKMKIKPAHPHQPFWNTYCYLLFRPWRVNIPHKLRHFSTPHFWVVDPRLMRVFLWFSQIALVFYWMPFKNRSFYHSKAIISWLYTPKPEPSKYSARVSWAQMCILPSHVMQLEFASFMP